MKYVIETEDEDFHIEVPDEARVEIERWGEKPSAIRVDIPVSGIKDGTGEYPVWSTVAYYEKVQNFRAVDTVKRVDAEVA